MLLLVVVVATVNVGLGFALAVYLARRHRMLVAGGIDSAANPPPQREGDHGKITESFAASVQSFPERVQRYNEQHPEMETQTGNAETLGGGGGAAAIDQEAVEQALTAAR